MVKTQNLVPSQTTPASCGDGRPQPESVARTIPETYWERVADKLDCVLQGCSNYWPEYDAERLRVFARALDEVRDQCRAEGLNDLAPLAKEHRGIFLILNQETDDKPYTDSFFVSDLSVNINKMLFLVGTLKA